MKTAENYLKEKFKQFYFNHPMATASDIPNSLYVEAMEEYAQSKQEWVDVNVERPEIGVIVNLILTHSEDDVYSGFRANGGWYVFQIGEQSKYFIPNGIKEAQVTKWQPLPPPPQDADKKKQVLKI